MYEKREARLREERDAARSAAEAAAAAAESAQAKLTAVAARCEQLEGELEVGDSRGGCGLVGVCSDGDANRY